MLRFYGAFRGVSTHSRAKAAAMGTAQKIMYDAVSTHSRAKAAAQREII